MLHDVNPDSEFGAALFTATAEQTNLLGWMAVDDDRQALGQRYSFRHCVSLRSPVMLRWALKFWSVCPTRP
ncbi:MAG: hypothetical protein ACRDSZ_07665 [Pseudonocardiaceae bacterium]